MGDLQSRSNKLIQQGHILQSKQYNNQLCFYVLEKNIWKLRFKIQYHLKLFQRK